MFSVRPAVATDREQLASMRHQLWPEGSPEEHAAEINAILDGVWSRPLPYVMFVATSGPEIVGFAEVSIRSRADGCDPLSAAGYLEGWFVREQWRRRGAGRALVRAAEEWVREQGCSEMGSDTWIDNESSQHAHAALGFEEVDRCVTYRKRL